MGLKDNLYYWEKSLENPEPILDPYYIDDYLIVSDSELIDSIRTLRDLITSYCVIFNYGINVDTEEIVNRIIELLTSKDLIQYNEFVAFWKVFDLSYSVFKDLNDEDKKKIIIEILKEYCERRKRIYDRLGYSNITIQALYDSGASRKKGKAGIEKLIDITKTVLKESIKKPEHLDEEIYYLIPDKGDEKLFIDLCDHFGIKFNFGKQYQNKKPDLVLKLKDRIVIIEAKHIKESGGAQNKQIVELIAFISQKEDNSHIHYVAFLDGIYFNKFKESSVSSKTEEKSNLILQQTNDIKKALIEYKNNFFVNTYGYKLLIEDLTS